jgi:GNAT superfamily N-acetyltransferase
VAALVDSLRYDSFYVKITDEFADNEEHGRRALARYFDYSMSEGAQMGRLVVWPDPSVGATGGDAYRRIIDFMRPRALAAVAESAWYLSIVGVAPSAQGRGIGTRLIEPTLAEADDAGVECYLETFDRRNLNFYQRLGFSAVGSHAEPVTGATYTILRRNPQARPVHSKTAIDVSG